MTCDEQLLKYICCLTAKLCKSGIFKIVVDIDVCGNDIFIKCLVFLLWKCWNSHITET